MMFRKRGKRIALLTAIAVLFASFAFGSEPSLAKITTADTPVGVGNAHLKWEKRFGTGYSNAVTPPLLIGDSIYLGSAGYFYKLDKDTGAILDKCEMEGICGFTTIAPAHNGSAADGRDATRVYVPICDAVSEYNYKNGRLAAIDITGTSMRRAEEWTNGESESFGKQAISPIVCRNGYIYTGGFSGEGKYVEIDAATGLINATLGTNNNGGYYWAGAYVTDSFAVFGEESVTDRDSPDYKKSVVKSVATSGNAESAGTVLSQRTVEGSVRGSMVCMNENGSNQLYFVTQAGKLYKMPVSSDGILGSPKTVTLSGASVGIPQVTGSRIYAGTAAAKVDVIDRASMTLKYSVSVPGYPQGELLVRQKDTATDYIYGTYNKKPGGIFFIEAGASGAKTSGILYDPVHPEFCISPVECDRNGTLFFKNDSSYIMAVEGGYPLTAPVLKKTAVSAASTKLGWNTVAGASAYEVYRATKSAGPYAKLGTVTAASFIDKKTLPKTAYYYKVRAKIGSAFTGYSNVISAKSTLAKPKIATRAGKRKIKITWKKITGASGYKVYQATKKKGKYKLVKTVKSQRTVKFIKTGLKKNKKYYYKVRAYRKVGSKIAYSGFSKISYKKVK